MTTFLAHLKAVCAFLGATLTFTLSVYDLPTWAPALAAVLTFVSVYAVPNINPQSGQPAPRRALYDD